MIAKGSDKLKAYVGSTGVGKMYLGDTLVYSSSTEDTADYFALTASAASTIGVTGSYAFSLEYSLDKASWNTFDSNTTVSLASGETAYFRGSNTTLASSTSVYTNFTMTGELSASGNIMSLLYGKSIEGKVTIPSNNCFLRLFYDCTALTSASALVLPATTLKHSCYYGMFHGCSALEDAPSLPATTLTASCYYNMFNSCSSLTSVPDLPAKTALSNCYYGMFRACTSLVNAPEIGLTTVVGNCCNGMFYGDNKMTEAPTLLSETLVANCYNQMFRNCTKLTYVKMLALNGTDLSWGGNWLNYAPNTSSCIFVKHINATWTNSNVSNGVPTNWTVIYYNPATDKYYLSDKTTECDDHGNVV